MKNDNIQIDLPVDLSLEEAIAINNACYTYEGIERIADDGTIYFSENQMSVLKSIIGYSCKSMKLHDVGEFTDELIREFQSLKIKAS